MVYVCKEGEWLENSMWESVEHEKGYNEDVTDEYKDTMRKLIDLAKK